MPQEVKTEEQALDQRLRDLEQALECALERIDEDAKKLARLRQLVCKAAWALLLPDAEHPWTTSRAFGLVGPEPLAHHHHHWTERDGIKALEELAALDNSGYAPLRGPAPVGGSRRDGSMFQHSGEERTCSEEADLPKSGGSLAAHSLLAERGYNPRDDVKGVCACCGEPMESHPCPDVQP